jgi:hypothetical protein
MTRQGMVDLLIEIITSPPKRATLGRGDDGGGSKLAAKGSIRGRVDEIARENEQECRWGRKELLSFYCDVLETGAGSLQANDRLCQGVERTIVEHHDSKGRVVRTVTTERLIMPAKMEAGEGIRRMLGWDRKPETEVPDDIT